MELTRSLTIAVLMFVALASLVVAALNATATTLQQEPVAGQPSPAAPAASHATIIATWITAAGAAIGGVIALRIVIHWCMIRRVFRGSGGTIIALLGESQCKVMPSCANVVEDPISYESENVYFEVGEDKYMLCTRALGTPAQRGVYHSSIGRGRTRCRHPSPDPRPRRCSSRSASSICRSWEAVELPRGFGRDR